MKKTDFIPVDVTGWDQHDTMCFSFNGTMQKDWGPFKEGEKVNLFVDFENGMIANVDDEGQTICQHVLSLEIGEAIPFTRTD